MFQSAYQDGDCVEVFSPAGKNPGSEWKSSGKIARIYEKGVKGYVELCACSTYLFDTDCFCCTIS